MVPVRGLRAVAVTHEPGRADLLVGLSRNHAVENLEGTTETRWTQRRAQLVLAAGSHRSMPRRSPPLWLEFSVFIVSLWFIWLFPLHRSG